MRVYKNLFGNGSKINASEIVTKNPAGEVTALDLLGVECGSNANGEWVRFNFGLQVCWGKAEYLFTTDTVGNVHRDVVVPRTIIYPTSFLAGTIPVFLPQISGSSSAHNTWIGSHARSTTNTQGSFRIMSALARTNETAVVDWLAIGWWKEPGT